MAVKVGFNSPCITPVSKIFVNLMDRAKAHPFP